MRDLLQGVTGRWQRRGHDRSGQSLIEFSLSALVLILLLFGMIDFGRSIYYREVMINLAREASNEAARSVASSPEQAMTNAVNAALVASSPLQTNSIRIIISSVMRSGTSISVTAQVQAPQGGYAASSKLRNGPGTVPVSKWPATSTVIPQPNRTAYVTEVFYHFTPTTPLGKLARWAMPTQLYDVAYFM